MDFIDWVFAAMMALLVILVAGLSVMLAGMGWLAVECYRSGDPDSMACYVTNSKTSRVKVDVSVK